MQSLRISRCPPIHQTNRGFGVNGRTLRVDSTRSIVFRAYRALNGLPTQLLHLKGNDPSGHRPSILEVLEMVEVDGRVGTGKKCGGGDG